MNTRFRSIVALLFAALLFPFNISAQQNTDRQAQVIYGQAVAAFNSGNLLAARTVFEELFGAYPDFYKGYPLYWDVVGRTGDVETRKTIILSCLDRFDKVPAENRTEDFYDAAIRGYEIVQNNERIDALKEEVVEKFPRGLTAQSALLDAAEQEKDPIRAAAMLQSFLQDFDDNVGWTWMAAKNRFELIADNPDLFDPVDSLAAAEKYDRLAERYIDTFGDPFKYTDVLFRIALAFQDSAPNASLGFAEKGLAFIRETGPNTENFDEQTHIIFLPAMLRAYINLENWPPALKTGETLIGEIDGGLLPASILVRFDEGKIRRDYAVALEKTGAIEQAREQLAWSASLNDDLKGEFDSFSIRHPLQPEEMEFFKASLASKRAAARNIREGAIRKKLLATEIRQHAADFRLQDLAGKYVELTDFRGKTLILGFWATWCGPCRPELEELKIAYEKYKNNPLVSVATISIDEDKSLVAPFAKRNGYDFPVLLTDGTVEAPYQAQGIPKLYIIDANGRARFILEGYVKDDFFLEKLDWMIEAVKRAR